MRRQEEELHQRFAELMALRRGFSAGDEAAVRLYEERRAELRDLLTPAPKKPGRLLGRAERLLEKALEKIPGYQKL